MTCNGDRTFLCGVMKLAMTALLPNEAPSIELHLADSVPDLHQISVSNDLRPVRYGSISRTKSLDAVFMDLRDD